FAPGDPVRARREPPDVAPPAPSAGPVGRGPCKLPRYLRGTPGAVTAVRPAHVLPDTHAVFAGEHPEHVYTVAFAAPDVWGPGADPHVTVHADLFESYLEPR
ncbi:SH3-like domain-containing protein, partial [Pseudonocardia sp. McavD-2-B]